jgi:hypothetical protein
MLDDRLFIAKLLTLAVAFAMLVFNVVRYKWGRHRRAASRIRTFSFLVIAAGVLLVVHPYNPHSFLYVAGIILVGGLVACAVFCEYRAWR